MWWWRSNSFRHLPLPQGPHAPGCTDVMTSYGKNSAFVRVYYPTVHSQEQNDSKKWFGWSPHNLYLEGLAALVTSWTTAIKMLLWYYGDKPLGEPQVPAMWEAEPLEVESSGRKLPVVVFSHGYGATRFLSSTIFYQLASRGFFVTSIEHRDSSPSATYYYESPEALEKDERTWIPHLKIEFGPNHYEIRNEQLHNRTKDVINVLDLLENINKGEASNILKTSFDINKFKKKMYKWCVVPACTNTSIKTPEKLFINVPKKAKIRKKWLQLARRNPDDILDNSPVFFCEDHFRDRLDLGSICMMGHSFGGATSLLAMEQDKRISCGVILDGWMFPLKEENLHIDKPLLFINTLTFHIESNLKVMETYLGRETNEVYTMRNTTHESQTDTPHIIGYWFNWFMAKLDPVVGTDINNHLTLRFLHKNIGFPEDVSDSEKYLSENENNFVKGTLLYYKALPKRKL